MLFIALSMPRTTFAMLPVTDRIVTAVWTLELTASILDASRRRLTFSFCFRMAFCAYIFAMSAWFCWMAFFNLAFSACSSLPAFAACRLSCFVVNCSRQQLRYCPCQPAILTLRLKSAFSRPDMMVRCGCVGCCDVKVNDLR